VPGLKDIAKNLRRTVTLAGVEVSIRGLTGDELAALLNAYSELGKFLTVGFQHLDAAALGEQAPECVARIIAIGTSLNGHAPEEKDIAEARTLPGVAALELLAMISELTLPRQVVRPFVEAVLDRAGEEASDDITKALGTR
jgi:hypothetical protein